MNFDVKEKDVKEYVKERFKFYYPDVSDKKFNELWKRYKELPEFKINENIFADAGVDDYDDKLHMVLRQVAGFYLRETFKAMKIDLSDPNVAEDLSVGNVGTPGRVIKMFTGADTHDDREFMGGRFHVPVRLAKFPNTSGKKLPVIKEIDLYSVCSHHLAFFGNVISPEAKAIVAYIPDKFVLGISKLQRLVRFVGQRGWLQEDLTKAIYDEIAKAAETESVYVKLENIKHLCEVGRGALSHFNDGFTTEYYGGEFETDPNLLERVRNS